MKLEEKLKIIANVHLETDQSRSFDEVYLHMLDWSMKGHLSKDFIEKALSWISAGRTVQIRYEPNKYYHILSAKS